MDLGFNLNSRIIGIAVVCLLLAGCEGVSANAVSSAQLESNTLTPVPFSSLQAAETLIPISTNTQPSTPTPTLDPGWGERGERCANSTGDGTWGIYLTDFDLNSAKRITSPNINYHFPQFSPDGRFISFTSFCKKTNGVFLYALDSGKQNLAYEEAGYFGYPRWSPDGSSVAFTRYLDGVTVLYRFFVQDWRIENLLSWTGVIQSFSWSPDGAHIALSAGDNIRMVLYRFDLDDGSLTQLSADGEFAYNPSWSPKGEWVAYIASDTNNGSLSFGDLVALNPFMPEERFAAGLEDAFSKAVWFSSGDSLIVSAIQGLVTVDLNLFEVRDIINGRGGYIVPTNIIDAGNSLLFSESGCCSQHINILPLDKILALTDNHDKWMGNKTSSWNDEIAMWAITPDWAPGLDLIVFAGLSGLPMP